MMNSYQKYISRMASLHDVRLESSGTAALIWVLLFALAASAVLWFTPWVQTAYGSGVVSTLSAQDRTQPISALVPGQIARWHVIEGQAVRQGEPIVTLADQDPELLMRLEAELQALSQQRQANEIALKAAEQELERAQLLLKQGIVSADSRDKAQRSMQSERTKLAQVDAKISQMRTRLARQSSQTKHAPADGIITRLYSGGLATAVKTGDVLATFIPDDVTRSVKIEVSGLDVPLVKTGRKVRLQFEGWPIFQLSGWPSRAIGTFGGEVEFVDPVANPQGRFNVWIKEDPYDDPWPSSKVVRLGSRANAWVILEQVRLGYEVWRQLNNFPPESDPASRAVKAKK